MRNPIDENHLADVQSADRKQSAGVMIKVYPFGVLLIGLLLNYFVLGVNPLLVALPSSQVLVFVVVAVVLLVINHSWLMTTTELTRLRFNMHASPEEWQASGNAPEQVSAKGWRELERHHNAHRNTTENTVYFAILVGIFILVSPTLPASAAWIAGFAIARVGHTYSYLSGNTNLRGVFMSLSLVCMYGLSSYLVMALIV